MSTPGQQRSNTGVTVSKVLLVAGAVMFVLAAFAAGGHALEGVPALSWFGGGFAAWVLAGVIP
jgi:hypothetical protein